MTLPECDVHGVWVRSLDHDAFGRICYRIRNMRHQGSIDYLVMWEPGEPFDTKRSSASYATPESLMVRPYQPRPWHHRPVKEVIY